MVNLASVVNFLDGNRFDSSHCVVAARQAAQRSRIAPRFGDPQALNPDVEQDPAILAFDIACFGRAEMRLHHANANDACHGISAQEPHGYRALGIWRQNLNFAINGEGNSRAGHGGFALGLYRHKIFESSRESRLRFG
jgi:hypothetical protein